MRITRLAMAATLALLLAPLASAATSADALSPECGIMQDAVCWSEHFVCYLWKNDTSGDCLRPPPMTVQLDAVKCDNFGIVSQVTVLGENDYCSGGDCTNRGVVLLVGRTTSCYGDGLIVACVDSTCETAGDIKPAQFAEATALGP